MKWLGLTNHFLISQWEPILQLAPKKTNGYQTYKKL